MRRDLQLGTVAGTLLCTLPVLGADELLKTAILAAVGATASFLVSWLLRTLSKRRRR